MHPLCPQLKQTYQSILTLKDAFGMELKEAKRTGDFTKLEELRKDILEKQDFIESSPAVMLRVAKHEMKNEKGESLFLGSEAIQETFGFTPEHIPPIPFSRKELARARELNQFLILRTDKTNDGKPLTMAEMNRILKGRVKDGGKTLASDGGSGTVKDAWYKNEAFFTQDTPHCSWALVNKEVILASSDANYLQQTETIVKYLEENVFKGTTVPTEFQSAIEEFEQAKEEIEELMGTDVGKATEKLEHLAITKMTRQTPAEALYDILVSFQSEGRRLLDNKYAWTSKRDSDGDFIIVGIFDSDGALVYGSDPGDSFGRLGVSFSRRV